MIENAKGRKPKERRKQRLSDTWIARHKLTLPQEDWFDTALPDLVLRMSYGGTRTFRVRYRDRNGKSRTHKLGRWDAETFNVEAARKAARKFDPLKDLKQASTEGMSEDQAWWVTATVADVVKKYIAEVVVNFRTRYETERCFNRYIVPALGHKVFVELKKSDAGQMRRNMRRSNGTRQADIVFALLRTVMMWVEDEEILDTYESPLRYRPKRRGKNRQRNGGRERVLDDDELRMVWHAATQMGGLYGALVRLLLLTAQRRQCLATAKWSEIVDDTWHIREEPGEPKGTGQVLPLPPLALDILRTLPRIKDNPYVFGVEHNDEHKPLNSWSQRKTELEKLMPRKIPRWTLHDLRRTARTRLEDIGVDMQTGEVVLGHALPGVKRTYIRSQFKEKRADALLRLSQHIADVLGLPPDQGTPRKASNVVPLATRRA
ncbi:MAG: integrase family protein [Nitrobacter sp.]|uniref:tyrosine-type recombinase/integrase n=1 Tax=Nitrobacter sp. TaxID=29420 RepID=UPI002630FB76|nr:integrase family protein [Nitrobacter sp.]MCV0387949.1 integrase family protein [Nitrobacter sp.]